MSVTDKNLAPETAPAVSADVLKEALQAAEEAERNLPATEPRKNEGPVQTLSASGLMKRYGSRRVVKDVSVAVKSGEVVGLLGPNGAGKTTSFYMIVGLVPPNGGKIELNGIDVTHLPIFRRARLGVSYLPQEASVFRRLSVETRFDFFFGNRAAFLIGLQFKHRTNMALSLSGGERRRTEIARALATNPRFILLDEPFAGVDPIAVIEIQRIVRFLKDRGIGVLITDHNVRETLGICDHAYIINEGEVLASGAPDDIVANEKVRRIYLGENFRM